MPMLAGTGLFIIQNVLPKLPGRGSVLGIAKMIMAWSIDDVLKHLNIHGLPFEQEVVERIRRRQSRYTSKDFFEALGFKDFQDIDFDPSAGCSITHDLNHPLPEQYENRFDLVVENGTIEHIFDVKTAVGSIAKAVKVGGLVCHVSPLDAFNHGFYNFSINFFNDFYRANGFEECEFFLMRSASDPMQDQTLLVERLPYSPEEFFVRPDIYQSQHNKLGIGFVAVKRKHYRNTVVPIQALYDRSLKTPV